MKKLISFCINTATNELEYIKLLFKSLQENLSTLEHEIIVFIDSDNQGTFEWLQEQQQIFPYLVIIKNPLPVCYGYARNINEMFKFASNDIVSYLQSDMVISNDYDLILLKHIKPNMVLSSTRIEPPLHGPGPEKHTQDFGTSPSTFKYEEFLNYSQNNMQDRTTTYFFAPFTLYKATWNNIGGHDTRFRRSREDSDILNRLILSGVEIIQTWDALVYHFTCTSSRGPGWFDKTNTKAQERVKMQEQADRVEMFRFFKKWGNFSHGSPFNYYYKISSQINVDVDDIGTFNLISSFFDVNYINSKELYNIYVNQNNHQYANQLLNFSNENWEEYSYMYNTEDVKKSVQIGNAEGDIIVSFNLSNINKDTYNDIISNLQHIIHQYDEGKYHYNGFIIEIKFKNNIIKDKIKVTNPEIKEDHKYLVF